MKESADKDKRTYNDFYEQGKTAPVPLALPAKSDGSALENKVVTGEASHIGTQLVIQEQATVMESIEEKNPPTGQKKFAVCLENFAGKDKRTYNDFYEQGKTIIQSNNSWLTLDLLQEIQTTIEQNPLKGQKEFAYKLLHKLVAKNPRQVTPSLSVLIPMTAGDVNSSIKEVKDSALKTLKRLLNTSGNEDLKPFIPVVLDGLVNPKNIPSAVEKLASCIFVQNVEAPALAVTTPILMKGLKERNNETNRKCCVIIDNMCKLVEQPKEAIQFSKDLKPLIHSVVERLSDPEARKVAAKSLETLKYACTIEAECTRENVEQVLLQVLTENDIKTDVDASLITAMYSMTLCQEFSPICWEETFRHIMSEDMGEHVPALSFMCVNVVEKWFEVKEDIFEDPEEGIDLYKGSFSLAYGALTLLNNANVHLKRNRFYGLLGPNNCGKTTLMRAIANEQVEGFPKRDELKTVFVEHEIQEREVGEDEKGFPIMNIDLSGVEWVVDCCNKVYILDPPVDAAAVVKVMEVIGFGNVKKDKDHDRAADMWMGVTTYSGGWKMKMQLCAATLMNADILMLDEPTGHLDTRNVQWIKDWLKSFIQNGGSIISTSHDSPFLNDMCTHLIDFQNRKLKTFRGTYGGVLSEFVNAYPEKQGYFELKNDVSKFVFPDPTPLDGVKSMSKSILRMKHIYFTYPTRDKPTITNVSLECSRISRVAVIGANGAGKSTAIKVLIGELKASQGEMWKHPNARIAYIAQHAFQHLEKHIHKTATQYILWRFAGNDDKENIDFLHKEEKEDNDVVKKKFMVNPKELTELKECFGEEDDKHVIDVEKLVGRRENKREKTKEYESKQRGKTSDTNMWIKRDILIQMGLIGMVQRQDEKEAVMAGLMSKPLTSVSVEKHLEGFGIEPEHASHTLIRSLSGGQKVKVVLAACLWQNPHLVILDEPTNYLDRDGLGALTKAIEAFKGGVIIISHNKEFANAVSQEKWIMEKGLLRKEGDSVDKNIVEEVTHKIIGDDIVKDSYGNEIKVEKTKTMTVKEKKIEIKNLQKKIKDGRKRNTLSDDQIFAIEDKIDELKK